MFPTTVRSRMISVCKQRHINISKTKIQYSFRLILRKQQETHRKTGHKSRISSLSEGISLPGFSIRGRFFRCVFRGGFQAAASPFLFFFASIKTTVRPVFRTERTEKTQMHKKSGKNRRRCRLFGQTARFSGGDTQSGNSGSVRLLRENPRRRRHRYGRSRYQPPPRPERSIPCTRYL